MFPFDAKIEDILKTSLRERSTGNNIPDLNFGVDKWRYITISLISDYGTACYRSFK